MLVKHGQFDCALPLRTWSQDPQRSINDNLLSLIECYSQAYRRLVIEIRRLEANPRAPSKDSDYSEIQQLVDASIAHLDPNQ